MKNLYLGYETAQWYWEHAKVGATTVRAYRKSSALFDCATTPKAAREVARGALFEKQMLAVLTNKRFSRNEEGVFFHEHVRAFPKGSFIKLSDSIFIASPELSFVQTASYASFGKTLLYGLNLCGSFALDENSESGTAERQPITTPENISRFLEAAEGIPGKQRAQKAIRYLCAGSASPRESQGYLALSMPPMYGGKNLAPLEMNKRIDIPTRYKWPGQRRFFIADFYWPGSNVVAEYDSDVEHSHADGIFRDSVKRNTLTDMGYTPLCITRKQLNDPCSFDQVAEAIRRALGRRKARPSSKRVQRECQLRHEIGLPQQ